MSKTDYAFDSSGHVYTIKKDSGYTTDGIGYQKTDTSYQAATENKKLKLSLRQQVLQYFIDNPKLSVQAGTIAFTLDRDLCQIQPRITELVNLGKLEDSGHRGKTKYGKSCILWRLSNPTTNTSEEEPKY